MKKRVFAVVLTAVIAFSSLNVFAQEQFSKEVEKAIVNARQKIDIDDEYSEFSYETQVIDNQNVYQLCWENEEGDDVVNINIKADGEIIYYANYDDYSLDSNLVKVRNDEAKKIAESFIKKAIPERAGELTLLEEKSYPEEIQLNYGMRINDIPVLREDVYIEVSKNSGNVTVFRNEGSSFKDRINTKTDDLIDFEKAKEAFLNSNAIELKYETQFDYETKSANFYPIFNVTNRTINAHNGNVVALQKYDKVYNYTTEATADMMAIGAVSVAEEDYELSESELLAVEKTNSFISEAEAKNIVKKYNLVTDLSKVSAGRLSESSRNLEQYFWCFSGAGVYFAVDAKTGKLENFNKYNVEEKESSKKISESVAKDKINGYLKLLASDKLNEICYNGEASYYDYPQMYSLRFNRKIDNIECENNYIEISIDAVNGELISFYKNWYNTVNVIDKKINMTESEIFDIYAKAADFKLCYDFVYSTKDDEPKLDAVYTAKNTSMFYFDPENGQRLTRSGDIYQQEEAVSGYTDVIGHKYENEIITLYDSGYYLNRSEFMPDAQMTVGDFMELMILKNHNFGSLRESQKEEIEEAIKEIGLGSIDDKLSKMDCAKILVFATENDKLAQNDEIFAEIYSDVSLENRAEANIMNVILGISEDSTEFGGDRILTNGEGAYYIYNFINNYE